MTASENIRQILEVGYNGSDEQSTALSVALDLLEKKESGLIIELPVPIGTEVWMVDIPGNRVYPVDFNLSYLGKCCKSKEEAEKRLGELRGGE